jgi:DNA invertase Pin-like site-specific DNA recombinase
MKYIAYYRVSTIKQGQSGLGLEAQRQAVLRYTGGEAGILLEFTDIESGKNDNRPELMKAIEAAQKHQLTLVIAKLDRLSRNLTFISMLMDAHVKFVCCDMPQANEFTIHIFAALAQQERKMISERTKAALQSKKLQGVKLGKPENLTELATARGLMIRQANARSHKGNRQASELINFYRAQGLTYASIAERLNELGYKTRRGKSFHPQTVHMLFNRV